jgi:hypothetical protein
MTVKPSSQNTTAKVRPKLTSDRLAGRRMRITGLIWLLA